MYTFEETSDRIAVALPGRPRSFFRHGWQSWSPTRWLDPDVPPVPVVYDLLATMRDDPAHAHDPVHGGSAVAAVELEGGEVLLVGALDLSAWVSFDGGTLLGSREDGTSGGWFVARGEEQEVFAAYAERLAGRFGDRRHHRRAEPPPTVWCSWYGFYEDIDEQRLRHVLAGLDEGGDHDRLDVDVFQVDDGWQRRVGDWEPNERFGAGMADLASRVHGTGRCAGLWLAPFLAHAESDVAREHPEWLLRDAGGPVIAGVNWGGVVYALDLTHPDALAHAVDACRRAVGWGYDHLKLDFLYAGALPGDRHDPRPREQAYRGGVQAIRDAVGDDVYLAACGAPVLASLGVFDALRVGPDVAPYWDNLSTSLLLHDTGGPSTRNAIVTTLHRLWLGRVIDTDPDVAYVRERRNLLGERARGYLRDLAHLTGCRSTSDPPDWLTDHERETLVTFLRARPAVEQRGRYRYTVDGRDVDLSRVVAGDEPDGLDLGLTAV